MRVDDRVAKTWFRVPYWFTPVACMTTFNMSVSNSAGQNWLYTANLTELTEVTQFMLFRDFLRGYATSPIAVMTGNDVYIKHITLASIVCGISRLYYYPRPSVTGAVSVSGGRVTGGFDYTGVPPEVSSFLVSALQFDNPWNAIEAGIAWNDAPWGGYPSNFITCKRDDDLVRMPIHSP